MSEIELSNGSVCIEAGLIPADFGLDAPGVLEAMRTGRMTSVWERGMDHDAGLADNGQCHAPQPRAHCCDAEREAD